jgi:hypothetical protein
MSISKRGISALNHLSEEYSLLRSGSALGILFGSRPAGGSIFLFTKLRDRIQVY